MSHLFQPLTLRGLTLRNRILVSPMCQYSGQDGLPTDWHLVHLGSRAVGGAAMVIAEAAAVSPEGRITPADVGIWSKDHAQAFRRITDFIRAQGAVPAIQLAHAGRKASTAAPWKGGQPLATDAGGWQPLAPSDIAFDTGHPAPQAMTLADIDLVTRQFVAAAHHAHQAGFETIELHMAHGYLLHEFLSPLSNHRKDNYGGLLENRMRLPLRIATVVRDTWPHDHPLLVRISATDWAEGGWSLEDSIEFSKRLAAIGVDLVDCSSGGMTPHAKMKLAPGYQVPFASAVRHGANIATGAVGLITTAQQADAILVAGHADVVLLARELLRNPYWPLHAAHVLGDDVQWPPQYERARFRD